jgi:hypothetical protein
MQYKAFLIKQAMKEQINPMGGIYRPKPAAPMMPSGDVGFETAPLGAASPPINQPIEQSYMKGAAFGKSFKGTASPGLKALKAKPPVRGA